jgi:hypothetical protein
VAENKGVDVFGSKASKCLLLNQLQTTGKNKAKSSVAK